MGNICMEFAKAMAKSKGMTYKQATREFVRGYNKNSVYKNANEIHEAHCVHCARAEVLSNLPSVRKLNKVV